MKPSFDPHAHTVHLPPPRLKGALPAAPAGVRHPSCRAFLPRALTVQQVSALLGSAFGIDRPGSWGRSAPSARTWREITAYAILPDAAYRYDRRQHRLHRVAQGDLRALTGDQDFVATAPLDLVYAVDIGPVENAHEEEHGFLMGGDVGCIVENIYRYCAGAGLATVVRSPERRHELAAALGLSPTQHIELAQTVGWPKPDSH